MISIARGSSQAAARLSRSGVRWFSSVFPLLLLLVTGGGSSAGSLAQVAAATSPQVPPKLRLGGAAKPTHYALDLTVVPSQDTFTGTVDIDVQLRQPTSLLWLNAAELAISEAHAQSGDQSIPARVVPGGLEFAGFAFERFRLGGVDLVESLVDFGVDPGDEERRHRPDRRKVEPGVARPLEAVEERVDHLGVAVKGEDEGDVDADALG